jgi:hypothetical protein
MMSMNTLQQICMDRAAHLHTCLLDQAASFITRPTFCLEALEINRLMMDKLFQSLKFIISKTQLFNMGHGEFCNFI